jgi:hypothetical protein
MVHTVNVNPVLLINYKIIKNELYSTMHACLYILRYNCCCLADCLFLLNLIFSLSHLIYELFPATGRRHEHEQGIFISKINNLNFNILNLSQSQSQSSTLNYISSRLPLFCLLSLSTPVSCLSCVTVVASRDSRLIR